MPTVIFADQSNRDANGGVNLGFLRNGQQLLNGLGLSRDGH